MDTRRRHPAIRPFALFVLLVACGDDDSAGSSRCTARAGEPLCFDAGDDDAADGDSPDGSVADSAPDPDSGPPVIVLPDEREACASPNPLRNPYFGDLHVHTSLSFDAAAYDVRTRPADAYRFARGEPVGLPPLDESGNPTRMVQLSRPLDFAAVTDHSEFFGEIAICVDPSSAGYDSSTCRRWREASGVGGNFADFTAALVLGMPVRLCRDMPDLCRASRNAVWQLVQDAAEDAYDRTSACAFTSFVGYEWTGTTGGNNNHRNVIFRNRSVMASPVSWFDARNESDLWDALEARCNDTDTPCDVLAIPHNGNLGAGAQFVPVADDMARTPYSREDAERRARLEPLVEVYQHKGSSECLFTSADPLASEDELCAWERLNNDVCTGAPTDSPDCTPLCSVRPGVGFLNGCVDPGDMVRGSLRRGLSELARVGANPFQLGFIGSTDTHNGIAGAVDEAGFPGHVGVTDDDPPEQLAFSTVTIGGVRSSPGGLAVVWAEQNDRDSLFDAMRRRETYATSGPRIVARAFGGWSFSPDLCTDPGLVEAGYRDGVPMGAELSERPADATAPTFVVSALRDPMGARLERAQIVKGWLDADGQTHEIVYDVAGERDPMASVDLATCEPPDGGSDSLCGVWTDPAFDPSQPAFYYVRVVEIPTCRWSWHVCLAEGVDCATLPATDPLAACCDPRVPPTTQERAWTSPIWYVP